MKIGIISDTHNDLESTKHALEVFRSNNIDFLIHAGDLSSPRIIELFKGFKCRFVIGNTDIDIDLLNDECRKMGFECLEEICEITVEGKRILVMHGNVVHAFREAVASGKYDYIIKGHTHHFENYIRNNTRIVNPGSLYGTTDRSVAILDTDKDEVEKIDLAF
ncbi:MAG: YfcE family phosphodiesterase [Spirochaetes bacterium]|nr:YfcE family phosphodiesterase [Spirochaetota bacterium]